MNISTLRPLSTPLLLSMLLVASALLLWRVPAAQAAQNVGPVDSCAVLDKQADIDDSTRRMETMLMLHRGW